MVLNAIISIAMFACITALFWYAAGTLSPRRLNLISLTYYIYAVMVYLGTALAFIGALDGHYLINKLSRETIDFMFIVVSCSGAGLGLCFIGCNYAFGNRKPAIKVERFFDLKATINADERYVFWYVVGCTIVGVAATAYTFISIGSVPLIEVLFSGSAEAASIRWEASHGFAGVVYVRNVGMLTLVPLCNFMALAGWRIVKDRKWTILFAVTCVVCLIVLTYDLEKSLVAYHVVFLFVLACLLDFRPSWKQVGIVFGACVVIIFAGYLLTSGGVSGISFESGPLSRLVSTPAGALGLHLQIFPDEHNFLGGQSLPGPLAALLGFEEGRVRSGAVVMELVNPKGVDANTAGVMNAFFVGEAYANWGVPGIVASIVVVGAYIGIVHNFILRLQKTYFTVLVYCVFVKFHVMTMMGGFVDYLYISPFIALVFVLLPLLFFRLPSAENGSSGKSKPHGSQGKHASSVQRPKHWHADPRG